MSLPQGMTVSYGDTVMLVGKDQRMYIRTVRQGEKFQTHLGQVTFDDMVDVEFGEKVRTHLGHSFYVLIPTFDDILTNLKRETQIVYPKDLGSLILKLNLHNGVQVIEAGTGSGAFTLLAALMVGEQGQVYSYERRTAIQKLARKNVTLWGLESRVTFIEKDISDGFDHHNVNALFLDVPDPENYLDHARNALRGGGFFGAIVPTTNQMSVLTDHLLKDRWFWVEAQEVLMRRWKTVPARIRPDDQMVGHTGFLVFARAVYRNVREEPSTSEAVELP